MNDEALITDIAHYYDTSQVFYTHFWSRTALHYGLWYDDTRSLSEAVRNTDKMVSESLAVTRDDVVLDAGCGVGGTAIYIAETTGARVAGITLSSVQLRIAHAAAARSVAATTPTFSLGDYNRTNFPAASFTKLYGIESVCYARDKSDFMREAYRLLTPGGRLAVVDTFLTKDVLSVAEQAIYDNFIEGWVVPNLPTQHRFASLLKDAGFRNVQFRNLQQYIWPSVRRVFRSGLLTGPVNAITSRLGFARRNLSALYQKPFFDRQIAIYGLFVADKP